MNDIQTSDTESICPYCGKDMVVTDDNTGERFCKGCGFVIDERGQYLGAEWCAFSKEEYDDKSRTGSPTSLAVHDMGLATVIGYENTDANGRPLSILMKTRIRRLRTWDSRSQAHESVDRNLRHAFSELDKLGKDEKVKGATPKKYPAMLIGRMGVDKKYRRRGIGSEILLFCRGLAIETSHEIACRYVILHTTEARAHFYRGSGFVKSGNPPRKGIVSMYARVA